MWSVRKTKPCPTLGRTKLVADAVHEELVARQDVERRMGSPACTIIPNGTRCVG